MKIEDALIIEKANYCMDSCKKPVDILKRIISSNLNEVNMNI